MPPSHVTLCALLWCHLLADTISTVSKNVFNMDGQFVLPKASVDPPNIQVMLAVELTRLSKGHETSQHHFMRWRGVKASTAQLQGPKTLLGSITTAVEDQDMSGEC